MNTDSLFRCLGDPTRLTVLRLLTTNGGRTVTELVEVTAAEQTNLSHHLAQLRTCGLVVGRQDGRHVRYSLAHARLAELLAAADDLADHLACTDPQACLAQGCC